MSIGPWWTGVESFVITDSARCLARPKSTGSLRVTAEGIVWGLPEKSTAAVQIQWPAIRGIEISQTEDRKLTRRRARGLGLFSPAAKKPVPIGRLVVRGVGDRSFEFQIDGMTALALAERVAPLTTAARRAELARHLGLQTRPNASAD